MDKITRFRYSIYHPNVSKANVVADVLTTRKSADYLPIGDLHMHTSYSDGFFSPEEVVYKAKNCNLSTIAVTDHDTVNGIDEAVATGAKHNINVIPGIELSAMCGEREVHILGYFINHKDSELNEYLKFFRAQRVKRAREMVRRLNNLKIPVAFDSILQNAEGCSIGRPHIATAVLETGSVKSYLEVFHKYIGFGCPAYVEKYRLEVKDAITMISKAGGLSFLAHPESSRNTANDTVLFEIIKAGIDGIETIHPSLNKQKSLYYRGIAQEYYLLESGGSDFHGGKRDDEDNIGRYGIPLEHVNAMQQRLVA